MLWYEELVYANFWIGVLKVNF